jgi:hypothetical protein
VLQESAVASRFEAQRGEALTPFVGRNEEIDRLLRRWRPAMVGEGQVVTLSAREYEFGDFCSWFTCSWHLTRAAAPVPLHFPLVATAFAPDALLMTKASGRASGRARSASVTSDRKRAWFGGPHRFRDGRDATPTR